MNLQFTRSVLLIQDVRPRYVLYPALLAGLNDPIRLYFYLRLITFRCDLHVLELARLLVRGSLRLERRPVRLHDQPRDHQVDRLADERITAELRTEEIIAVDAEAAGVRDGDSLRLVAEITAG